MNRRTLVFRLSAFLVASVLVNGVPVPAADSWQELLPIIDLLQNKRYQEAIAAYEEFMQQAPKAVQVAVKFEIATLHAALGNRDRALALLEQAIQSGFDNCIAMQQDQDLTPARSDPRFDALYSRIRISPADMKELYWLKAEIQNISHDTKMIITENMTRVDTGITAIPQSMIPVRETTSPGVRFNRLLVKVAQYRQMQFVGQADKLRMQHVTKLTIISGPRSADQVMRSSHLAQQAAAARKRAIDARSFSLPPGAQSVPCPCSEFK